MTALLPFPPARERETLKQRAERWMREHPDALTMFVRFADEMRSRNRRFGIGQLTERVRWECAVTGDADFKVNNSFRAYIARWLVKGDPRLGELIQCRVTPAANLPAKTPRAAPRVDPETEEPIE